MEGRGGHDTYPECKHIPRSYPEEITEEEARTLPSDDKVLPLFESKVSDYKRIKLASLQTNQLLKCRWSSYVLNIEGRQHNPFKFPKLSDLHFHNCEIKFMPSLTPKNRKTFRMQMGPGPGVDQFGQMPIANDMHVSKSIAKSVESSKTRKK